MKLSSTLRCLTLLAVISVGPLGVAQNSEPKPAPVPPLTEQLALTPRPAAQLPLDMAITTAEGEKTTLGEALNVGRPTLIVPIWFKCRVLCGSITSNLVKQAARMKHLDRVIIGRDMNILMLDMKPTDTVADAAQRKAEVLRAAELTETAGNWNWAVVSGPEMKRFADAVGMKYRWDPARDVLNHPIFTVLATPTGKVSAYTIGPEAQDRLTERNILAARNNELGERAETGMKYACVSLEPGVGKHRRLIESVVNGFGVLTVLVLIGSIVHMSRKYRQVPPGNDASR